MDRTAAVCFISFSTSGPGSFVDSHKRLRQHDSLVPLSRRQNTSELHRGRTTRALIHNCKSELSSSSSSSSSSSPPSSSISSTVTDNDDNKAYNNDIDTDTDKRTLYDVLGLGHIPNPRTLSVSQIRAAYLRLAKTQHPDVDINATQQQQQDNSIYAVNDKDNNSFDQITRAWAILGDVELRRVYDASGEEGLKAVESIQQRRLEVDRNMSTMSGDQLDMLSDTGQLFNTSLLSPSSSPLDDDDNDFENAKKMNSDDDDESDACPRSVEEAIQNITSHPDESVKYYTLWWIYRFKVTEAEPCLIALLMNENNGGGVEPSLRLKRRAALALGVMARTNTAVVSLVTSFSQTKDYFLRYRCAEALAAIAYRVQQDDTMREGDNGISFDHHLDDDNDNASGMSMAVQVLLDVLKQGGDAIERRNENKTGFMSQESLFDLDAIEDEATRAKLRDIFMQRMKSEQQSKRTTMTPQLGVQKVGTVNSEDDEPYEWITKAVCAIITTPSTTNSTSSEPTSSSSLSSSLSSLSQQHEIETIVSPFIRHELPLVKYAAHKTLFCVTGDNNHATAIVDALGYGVEHHYSQRVLCRDLADMGYWQGANAITKCPMVENSFKILALKNMLSKLHYDATTEQVQQVLHNMDSLL